MAHIGIAAGTGIAAASVVGATAGWRFSFAAGWIATATVYLIWVWASIAKMSATAIEVIVQQRHPARRIYLGNRARNTGMVESPSRVRFPL